MEYKFTGYLVRKDQVPFPDIIIITADNVILKKWRLVGYVETCLRKDLITGLSFSRGLFFADVMITGHNISLIANGFLVKDAKKIKSLLNY